jgi:hypothetical protein
MDPRELLVERERVPAAEIDALEFSGFMNLLSQLERRTSIKRALSDAERG